jgi:hypothetical protein
MPSVSDSRNEKRARGRKHETWRRAKSKPSQMDASRTVKKNMIYDKRMRLFSPCLAIAQLGILQVSLFVHHVS